MGLLRLPPGAVVVGVNRVRLDRRWRVAIEALELPTEAAALAVADRPRCRPDAEAVLLPTEEPVGRFHPDFQECLPERRIADLPKHPLDLPGRRAQVFRDVGETQTELRVSLADRAFGIK